MAAFAHTVGQHCFWARAPLVSSESELSASLRSALPPGGDPLGVLEAEARLLDAGHRHHRLLADACSRSEVGHDTRSAELVHDAEELRDVAHVIEDLAGGQQIEASAL